MTRIELKKNPRDNNLPQTLAVDQTNNWKTYKMPNSSFTMKYPPDWVLENEGEGCVPADFFPPVREGFWIHINCPLVAFSEGTAESRALNESLNYDSFLEKETTVINGLKAIKQVVYRGEQDGKVVTNLFIEGVPYSYTDGEKTVNSRGVLQISLYNWTETAIKDYKEQNKIFDPIIKTFQFGN